MAQEVTVGDALVMCILGISENQLPHRAVYDIGFIAKNPVEMIVAVDASIQLKEIVDVHYDRETPAEPPHEIGYFEAGDGDPFWLDDDQEEDPDADL